MVTCPACGGEGQFSVVRFWGRGPNECYPDVDDCSACGGTGELAPMDAAQVEAIEEDYCRYEIELAEEEARALERAEDLQEGRW